MSDSKPVPHEICSECGKFRPVHYRKPRILCKNCAARLHPSKRRQGICANFANCPRGIELQEIWARGLCHSCLDWFRHRNRLDEWPTPSGQGGLTSF